MDDFDIEELVENVIINHKYADIHEVEMKKLSIDNLLGLNSDEVTIGNLSARKCLSYGFFEKIKSNHSDSHISKELSFLPVNKVMAEDMKLSPELCYNVRKTISSKKDSTNQSKSSKTVGKKYRDSLLKFDDNFLLENDNENHPFSNTKASSKSIKKVERSSILFKLELANSQCLDL